MRKNERNKKKTVSHIWHGNHIYIYFFFFFSIIEIKMKMNKRDEKYIGISAVMNFRTDKHTTKKF